MNDIKVSRISLFSQKEQAGVSVTSPHFVSCTISFSSDSFLYKIWQRAMTGVLALDAI